MLGVCGVKSVDIDEVMDRVVSFWPEEMSREDTAQWRTVLSSNLSGPRTEITRVEAHGWLLTLLDSDTRPSPNELAQWVRTKRRSFSTPSDPPTTGCVPMPDDFKRLVERCDA